MPLQMPCPIVISKEGKWFVASCPALDIATQGETEKEVKENMASLINDFLSDHDTTKPTMEDLLSLSLTNVLAKVPKDVIFSKAPTTPKKLKKPKP